MLSVLFLISANLCAIDTSAGALACGFLCKLCQKLHPTEPFCHCNFVSIRGCGGLAQTKAKRANQAGKKSKKRKYCNERKCFAARATSEQKSQEHSDCELIVFHIHVAFLGRKKVGFPVFVLAIPTHKCECKSVLVCAWELVCIAALLWL